MKNPKEFDCVQMKREIQQRLLEEYSEMAPEEARRNQQQRIAFDPLLGSFLRAIPDSSPASVRSLT